MVLKALTQTRAQVGVRLSAGAPRGHQLVLQRRDPPADVRGGDRFHKQGPVPQGKAAHGGLSVLSLRQQERQLASSLQVHVGPLKTEARTS